MLILRRIIPTAICFYVMVCLAAGIAVAATVTVNVAGKSAESDVKTLDPKVVRVMKDQIGVYVESTLLTPQQLKISFGGLQDRSYNVYVNRERIGAKSAGDLRDGIEWTIPGRAANQADIRCLEALQSKVDPVYKSVHARKGNEPWRAAYTLGLAQQGIRSGIRADQAYRSVAVIVVPAGEPEQKMVFSTRQDAKGTALAVRNCCSFLQETRARMYKVLTDAMLRNEVVEAMTPVTFTASCSVKNGTPNVTASIVNECDLPITGSISVSAPAGWKAVCDKHDIGKLQSGKTFKTSFALARSAKNASVPKSVHLSAAVGIANKAFVAKLWLYATASAAKP